MLTLSPGYFVEVLKHVARRTPGKKVIFGCGEQWTSRTCTGCGKVNNNLGLSKELECQKCGLCIDRDVNGALNNLKEVLNKLFEANGELKVLPPPPPPKQRKRRHQRRKGQQQNVGVVEGEDVQNNNIDEQ
jgi:transposase